MRISSPKLLVLVAFLIVVVVELRTVLAFVGVEVAFTTTLLAGGVVIGALVLWAVASSADSSEG